jgi:hypothetical protein
VALAALAALALAGAACGGRLIPSPVEGEPVCADFEIGATHGKMRGSLRHPVIATVLEGGKPISRSTLSGVRMAGDPGSRILLPDNGEIEVRWEQCENERAPRPVTAAVESKEAAHYECGKAEVYKTEKLVMKKGDPSSRKLTFAPPPNVGCWTSEAPEKKAPPTPPPPPAEPNAP